MSFNDIKEDKRADAKSANGETNLDADERRIPAKPIMVETTDRTSLPPHIKVDCSINEEDLLPAFGCILIFAGGALLKFTPKLLGGFPGGILLAAGALCLLARLFVDNYYIIDTAERKIYYRRKVFNDTSVTPFLEPDDIYAIGAAGSYCQDKYGKWWEYRVVIVKKDGTLVNLSDPKKADSAAEFNQKARGIAAVLGCGFIECPDNREMTVIKENNAGVKVYFVKKD